MSAELSAAPTLNVAMTQWHATRDLQRNLHIARTLIGNCGAAGADLVVLPENGLFLGTNAEMRAAALRADSEEIAGLCLAARKSRVPVVLGGFKRRDPDGTVHNTALVINSSGEIVASYNKIHLFDATIAGRSFEASSVESRGDTPLTIAIRGVKIGITICYDVRFPELYRQLALHGAQVVLVPASFTYVTGQAHWEILLRARAIENAVFVVAPATVHGGDGSDDAFPTYGHALAVGPWGEVIADLGDQSMAWKVVPLELRQVADARARLPVLRSVCPEAYGRKPDFVVVF